MSNRYNTVFVRDRILATDGPWSVDTTYGFDAYGRLGTVTRGSESASYGCLANSDLLSQTTSSSGGAVLTATRTWDYGSRLRSIVNTTNSASVVSCAYTYDGLGRRTQSALADGSWWTYGYDDRDEVVSGKRFWSDFSAVAGQQFEYGFDNIGNRTVCKEGGDRDGLNLRSEGYGCDSLNQYTSRTNSDQVDIVGAASPLATMTVSGASTARRGEYYSCALSVGSAGTPVAVVVTNTAALGGNTATVTGSMLVPPKTQSFAYDLDGNLTGDGLWTYTWDAENRLKNAETSASLTNWARCRLDLTYDHLGRRIPETVRTNWTGSAYQSSTTTRFVYDGWSLIAEINSSSAPVRSYVWGQDLSGKSDGAGGIGGLLMVKDHSDGSTHFPAYDGNGNVVALVKTDKTVTARYEYGPFGELIRASKPFATGNPFRFSTKYCDEETGLVYYGYRYYVSSIRRWTSRDRGSEDGGDNLYHFNFNNPLSRIDGLGDASHHPATMQLANSLPDGAGTKYLKRFTVPVVDPHYYTRAHREFNPAVRAFFEGWCKGKKVTSTDFAKSEQLAQQFVQDVMAQPKTSSIGSYLNRNMINGGRALKASVILGAAFDGYSTYANASALEDSLRDYGRDAQAGNSAWLDLDAIDAAVAVQNMTGDYFTTMYVLDNLLE